MEVLEFKNYFSPLKFLILTESWVTLLHLLLCTSLQYLKLLNVRISAVASVFESCSLILMTTEVVNTMKFFVFSSHVLQKVCQYFAYKVRFTNSATEIPEFHIAPEVALELLMAANFLDC